MSVRWCLIWSTLAAGFLPRMVAAAEQAPALVSAPVSFKGQVLPLVGRYCLSCHGGSKPKGGLDLSTFHDEAAVARDRKTWEKVIEFVEAREMPPMGKPQPSTAEINTILRGVEGQLSRTDCRLARDPGRVTLRRLNRAEYNNTIRDLFGIDFKAAADFPSDDVGYGFDNIGDVLTMPPILMEKYLAAAEKIAGQAIIAFDPSKGPNYKGPTRTWEAEDLDHAAGGYPFEDWARVLPSIGEIAITHTFPQEGRYLFRARAFEQQAGNEPARMAFRINGKTITVVDVTAKRESPGVYETTFKVHAGTRQLSVGFTNDYYNPADPDPNKRDRNLVVDLIEIQGPFVDGAMALPESHKRILFRKPTATDRPECVRAILDRFASRAYRRPATADEVSRLVRLADLAAKNGERFERQIQLCVEAILVSPQFLFRFESDPGPRAGGSGGQISEFELATRLSYFLWSSMPDEPLIQLALYGKLRSEGNLEAQIKRMLHDPRAHALVENFAGQWLQTRNLKTVSIDTGRFPDFDEVLRAAMLKETELFFESMMKEDHSVLDFLDSNYTFLNERLAHHYGIKGVKGDKFRRVSLQGDQRGGILTQASILTVTSNPTRTSPAKRGKWILEQVLGTPPPAPPPDVPELKDDQHNVLSGSLRKRMEQHRSNPNCASCHNTIDPLGFGFENYDAIGKWRDRDESFPIDPAGTLPSGQSFRSPKQLKAILQAREKEFTRCLAEKLLTYGLGRGLEYYDKCSVDRIVDSVAKNQHKFSRLVLEVVNSDPFQKRKPRGDQH